jgi:hypothetical protein
MANKVTKKMMYEALIAKYPFTADEKKFLLHEVELIEAKKANKKPTKAQEENEKLKNEIVEVIGNKSVTVSEVWKSNRDWTMQYSNQKFSALMNAMVEEGRLKKVTDKRVSYFSVNLDYEDAEEVEVDEAEGD